MSLLMRMFVTVGLRLMHVCFTGLFFFFSSIEVTTSCSSVSDGTAAINYLPTRWCPCTLEFGSTGICKPNLPRISDWMEWANSVAFVIN